MSSASQLLFPHVQGNLYEQMVIPGWTPDELFASGEEGFWYDFSDTTTMYQNGDFTNPVVSSGQPIKSMIDKTGNAHNLVETAGGVDSPVYTQETSEIASASFSTTPKGLTELLAKTTSSYLHNAQGFVAVAFKPSSAITDPLYTLCTTLESLSSSRTGYGMFFDNRSGVPASDRIVTVIGNSSPGNFVASTAYDDVAPIDTKISVFSRIDAPNATLADRLVTYIDNSELPRINTDNGTPASDINKGVTIGATYSLHDFKFTGDIYQVVGVDRHLTVTEMSNLNDYFNRKMFGMA